MKEKTSRNEKRFRWRQEGKEITRFEGKRPKGRGKQEERGIKSQKKRREENREEDDSRRNQDLEGIRKEKRKRGVRENAREMSQERRAFPSCSSRRKRSKEIRSLKEGGMRSITMIGGERRSC